jgi:hypothetical protein
MRNLAGALVTVACLGYVLAILHMQPVAHYGWMAVAAVPLLAGIACMMADFPHGEKK